MKDKVIDGAICCLTIRRRADDVCKECPYRDEMNCKDSLLADLRAEKSTIGIRQTATGIEFISTGDAKKGEERGILLGRATMYEEIKRAVIQRGIMNDELRRIFLATRID